MSCHKAKIRKMEQAENGNQEKTEEWYSEELQRLESEREEILSDAKLKTSSVFGHLEHLVKIRMKIACDYRDMQLKNMYNRYNSEVKLAWNEFQKGKQLLQCNMLQSSCARRKRLESHLRENYNPTIKKKSRRGRLSNACIRSGKTIEKLELQGLVRVALTPDEVNADIDGILNSGCGGLVKKNNSVTAAALMVSKGILHYCDGIYEIGDWVVVYHNCKARPTVRYEGMVVSVNCKEITIRSGNGAATGAVSTDVAHRIFISQLASGKLILKRL